MISNNIKRYIIDFLIGSVNQKSKNSKSYSRKFDLIGYTNDPEEINKYPIVIKPSVFFDLGVYGTPEIEPKLPLKSWGGIPILFGEPIMEEVNGGNTLLIHADLIASSFYLISRYEEMTKRHERDEHGRFPGQSSLAYRAGFIDRPIIDEYGMYLREIIQERGLLSKYDIVMEDRPYNSFCSIYLTHDVNKPYKYRGFKSFGRAIFKEQINPLRAFGLCFSPNPNDPYNTFHKILEWDKHLEEKVKPGLVKTIFFFKTPSKDEKDQPSYNLHSPYMQMLLSSLRRYKVRVGLHINYEAGRDPKLIKEEKHKLQRAVKWYNIKSSRHHYLSFREPEDGIVLQSAGIKHDFTMGYPDVVGFRLGTCRPVRFINPNGRSLTDLVMHPLYIMDYTLLTDKYINLEKEEAFNLVMNIVDQVAKYNGELNLLWHNESFSKEHQKPWLGLLYKDILRRIAQIEDCRSRSNQSV